MNYIKNSLLTLAIISAPLVGMDQEAPHRTNPCTHLKAAFFLGLAVFASKAIHDYQAAPDASNPLVTPITVGGNTGTTNPVPLVPMQDPVLTSMQEEYPQCSAPCLISSDEYYTRTRKLSGKAICHADCPTTVRESITDLDTMTESAGKKQKKQGEKLKL